MRDLRRRFGTIWSVAYHADPRRWTAYVVYIAIWQTMPLVAAVLIRRMIDAFLDHQSTSATVYAVFLGVATALTFAAARNRSRNIHILIEKSTEAYDQEIIRLSSEIPELTHLENPEYLDKLEQLRYQPQALGLNGAHSTVLIWGFIQAVLVVLLLVSISPVLLILPVACVPSLAATRWAERQRQRAFEASSDARRQANHFFELATSAKQADEVRTLRIRHFLLERHGRAWADADERMAHAERVAAVVGFAGRIVFAAAYFAAVVYVVEEGIRGSASIGDVVLTVILAGLLNQQISLILDSVSRVMSALTHVDRYLWLVDRAATAPRPEHPKPSPVRLLNGIRLEHVSFRYPDTERTVLDDVNLELPAGSVVALVGDNGAGKTTLVKLLTGMYRPTNGRIALDGVPLGEVDLGDWRAQTSAAFQDFARLELLLRESVGVGDLHHVDEAAWVSGALERAGGGDLIGRAGLALETPLGASFENGVNLSGVNGRRSPSVGR